MKFLYIIFFVLAFSCNSKSNKNQELPENINEEIELSYATGFKVSSNGTFQLLEISNPWPNSDRTYKYALINRNAAASITLDKDAYDGIILTPVNNIVVTSTTHLPALESLGVADKLLGFPGTKYISSPLFRNLVDAGQIRELGKNEDINTEVLLKLNPEVVISFGVDGTSKSLDLVEKAGIPIIYNGDWVESSPLAKAEWIKFFGYLFEKRKEANSIFSDIEKNYLDAKEIAKTVEKVPTVLSGAMYQDIWYLPGGESPEAVFFKDANVNYLWQDTDSRGSLSLSFESVFQKAREAEFWLSPSYYTSIEDLAAANPHYQEFEAYKNNRIYSFANKKGETGGVIYYEEGISRPDLVLKDVIKICHPELLPDYSLYFFQPLE